MVLGEFIDWLATHIIIKQNKKTSVKVANLGPLRAVKPESN